MPPKNVALHRPTTRSINNVTKLTNVLNPPSNSPMSQSDFLVSTSLPSPEIPSSSDQSPRAIDEDEVHEESAPALSSTTDTTNKRGRGASMGKSIEQEILKSGGKNLEIVFPEGFKKPIRHATHLANGIGIIVRHSPELDFTTSWKKVPECYKLPVYAGLEQWFDIKGWNKQTNCENIHR